jgi:hypothetical protein
MTNSDLWRLLRKVEADFLPLWVREPHLWKSVLIDYEPPFVERLWRQIDQDHRLFLHRVSPPKSEEKPLWHPHPWPSIIKVMPGSEYQQEIGSDSERLGLCRVAMTQVVKGEMVYEMLSEHSWHSVRPLNESWSIMIVGKPFTNPSPGYVRPTKPLDSLPQERIEELLLRWETLIPAVCTCRITKSAREHKLDCALTVARAPKPIKGWERHLKPKS